MDPLLISILSFIVVFRLEMSKNGVGAPPSYSNVLPQSAPPSYAEAIGGVKPSSPFTPQVMNQTTILTTVVPIGPNPTHMICPSCNAEIETSIKKTPSVMAWVSGLVIALMG